MRQPSMSQDGSKAAASVLRAVSDLCDECDAAKISNLMINQTDTSNAFSQLHFSPTTKSTTIRIHQDTKRQPHKGACEKVF